MIVRSGNEDLCLPFEPAEALRVDDAVAVSLKRKAGFIFWFRVYPPEHTIVRYGVWSEKSVGLPNAILYVLHNCSLKLSSFSFQPIAVFLHSNPTSKQ